MSHVSAALLFLASPSVAYGEQSIDGSIELELRHFLDSGSNLDSSLNSNLTDLQSAPSVGLRPRQISSQASVALSVDYFKEWNNGNDRLEVEVFGRLDEADRERSHADFRQFLWTHYGNDYEFSAGLGRVFWGVTETQHLVDVINQTDSVENIDGEDKLGQPMLRYQRFTSLGSFEAFILPYFRERTFEGPDGRLSGGLLVDQEQALYESSDGRNNIDLALRYAHSIGPFDLGLAWFSGTSRDPELFSNLNPFNLTTIPLYSEIDQVSADIQATVGGWLLKLEARHRDFKSSFRQDFYAATVGAEYTLVGVFGTPYDVGLLAEYSKDDRDQFATTVFQDDLSVGARIVLNDLANSEFLIGVSDDLTYSGSHVVFLEGSTRLNKALSLNIELRSFTANNIQDPLFAFRDSSFVQVGLEYFFN